MSHDQEVTRDAVTGRYESPQDKGPEDYTATEEHFSPWRKEAESLLDLCENPSLSHDAPFSIMLDVWAVQLMTHIQSLKRP